MMNATLTLKNNMQQLNTVFMLKHPAHIFALGFGSGLSPKAPGTFGSLAALPLFLLIAHQTIQVKLGIVAVLFALGIYFCNQTGKALGVADHPSIVWDEIVGMMLVLTFTPPHWFFWLVAFALFRLFDIWKPFPIRLADRKIKNGFGVMFDDILAAIYAIVCMFAFTVWMIVPHQLPF